MADELGSAKVINMVMLGALVEITKIVSPDTLLSSLEKALGQHRQNMIPLNKQALKAGIEYASKKIR